MNFIHEIINYITGIPASEWQTLATWLAGSTVVASVLQVAKHKLNFADMQKVVVFALGFLSFLVAFADFLLQNVTTVSALPFLGQATGALMAGAVIMHRFVVSGAYYKVTELLKKFSGLLKEIEAEEKVKTELKAIDESNLAQFQVL
jgi:hypothetical protein